MEFVPFWTDLSDNKILLVTMALKVGQLEKLTNSELRNEFIKDKASRTNNKHQDNLRKLHEQAHRGNHGMVSKKNP
jgi:hypothetical protein